MVVIDSTVVENVGTAAIVELVVIRVVLIPKLLVFVFVVAVVNVATVVRVIELQPLDPRQRKLSIKLVSVAIYIGGIDETVCIYA